MHAAFVILNDFRKTIAEKLKMNTFLFLKKFLKENQNAKIWLILIVVNNSFYSKSEKQNLDLTFVAPAIIPVFSFPKKIVSVLTQLA